MDVENQGQRRKRAHKEVTAERRRKETEAIHELTKALPISHSQVERANQSSLLRVAVNYIKMRQMMDKFGNSFSTFRNIGLFGQQAFCGFVMVVSLDGTVLFADDNITEQLGPNLVDVIGVPFKELLHPDDQTDLKDLLAISPDELIQSHMNKKGMFVLKMRTIMSATIKSESRIQYKNVFITSHLTNLDKSSNSSAFKGLDSTAAVLFCRTEALIGFPEIILSSRVHFDANFKTRSFSDMELKGQWLLGYRIEDIIGQDVKTWKHPSETMFEENCPIMHTKMHKYMSAQLVKEGSVRFPVSRWLSGWGDWLWVTIEIRPNNFEGQELVAITGDMHILGLADGKVKPDPKFIQWITNIVCSNGDLSLTGGGESPFNPQENADCLSYSSSMSNLEQSNPSPSSSTGPQGISEHPSTSSSDLSNSFDSPTEWSSGNVFSNPSPDPFFHQNSTHPSPFSSTSAQSEENSTTSSTNLSTALDSYDSFPNLFTLPLDVSSEQPLFDGDVVPGSQFTEAQTNFTDQVVDSILNEALGLTSPSNSSSSGSSSGYISDKCIEFSALSTDTALPERSAITDDSAPTDSTQQRPPFSKMTSTEELLHSLMETL